MEIDYSVYLVTDSTPAILGRSSLEDVVRAAVEGGMRALLKMLLYDSKPTLAGVTVVQYRNKHSDTGDLIRIAQALRAICKQHAVPLIINDRVDVALAVDADGVHLGQTDMSK